MCAGWLNWQCQWDDDKRQCCVGCAQLRRKQPNKQKIYSKQTKTFIFYLVFTSRSNLMLICTFNSGLVLVSLWMAAVRWAAQTRRKFESKKNETHNNNNNHNKPLSSVLLTSFSMHSERTSRIYRIYTETGKQHQIDKNRHAIPKDGIITEMYWIFYWISIFFSLHAFFLSVLVSIFCSFHWCCRCFFDIQQRESR